MRTLIAHGGFAVAMGMGMAIAPTARAEGASTSPGPAGSPVVPAAATPTLATKNDEAAPLEVPSDLVQVHPGGLTAEQAGARSATTSWNARASVETLRSAEARVDQAWASFLPRLTGIAKYTRVSNFTSPSFFNTGGASLVVTKAGPGAISPADLSTNGTLIAAPVGASQPFFLLDNWLLEASLTIPISDYFLRIDQNYTAATRSVDAARWDLVASRAAALSNGKIEYYTWLRNRGAVIVATQALNDQKTHLRDSRNQFAVGNASKADVLRAETAVASAELALEQATDLSELTEKQLRTAMHLPEEQRILPGEDLEGALPPVPGNLPQLTSEALSARAEVKSADANADAAREQESASRAGRYPSLSAFGDAILGNPNPRVVPPTNAWFPTWDVGAQLTWSPNDIVVANGAVHDYEARVANIQANKGIVRDGIEVEVQQDLQGVHEADFAVESSTREVSSAEEAYRVQRELFNNGRGTSATLTDAEADLTRARLDLLNAKANARIARIRVEHALGRDVPPATGDPTSLRSR